MKRRLGQFFIPTHLVTYQPEQALAILRGVVVVRAEQMFFRAGIEYMGVSDHFSEVPEGETAPYYDWAIDEIGPDVVRVTWEKLP
jgi:regulation of enolase protein 1 (concanavalin A-like superfamily)